MRVIETAAVLTGLAQYLADEQLAQFNSTGVAADYLEDPGRPAVLFAGADVPDTALVLTMTGYDDRVGDFDVALAFRAPGVNPNLVGNQQIQCSETLHVCHRSLRRNHRIRDSGHPAHVGLGRADYQQRRTHEPRHGRTHVGVQRTRGHASLAPTPIVFTLIATTSSPAIPR